MSKEVVHIIAVVTLEGLGKSRVRQRRCWSSSSLNFRCGMAKHFVNSVLFVSLQGFSKLDGTNGVPRLG